MRTAELYLSCTQCKRIVDWDKETEKKNEKGETVKNYEHTGVCPHCGCGQMVVVEVTGG